MNVYIYIFCFNIFDYSTTSLAKYASVLETLEAGQLRIQVKLDTWSKTILVVPGQHIFLDGLYLNSGGEHLVL